MAAVVLGAFGCGGGKSDFIGSRVSDRCDESWPVCDRVASCILGNRSYTEGRVPSSSRILVQLAQPSRVRLSFFVESITAQGETTAISFFEDGCRERLREEVTGQSFSTEATETGVFSREVLLTGIGDHLIEFSSDSKALYAAKIDVTPQR
jgi:hypothetical protein